ncbi:MAG TPA: DNA polymerase III subunit beta [Syntrophomonadaceae bacterium]|jgi:DNA polymerase-3 subunit beta|nr:DNA polymerase III subunit beta [Syntrophomonadaceae bacterium]
MKFNIEKREISILTTLVHRAAATRTTVPVLSGLHINISRDKGLTMTATDMEIGIKASTLNVDIIEEGSVLVNATYFADFIKLLPDTLITFSLNQASAKLSIGYGRSSSRLNIYQERDYPDLPIGKMEKLFSIPQDILREGLRKTSFATAVNHFRQVFTGVLFDCVGDGNLKVVASDTHRMGYYSYTLPHTDVEPTKFVIPMRTVNELLRLLEDSPEEINIALSDNNVVFYKESFVLVSRLIEGQYPNYETVIPPHFISDLTIKTSILASSLGRAKIMPTDDKFQIQHVRFSLKEGEVELTTNSETMGEICEVIDDVTIEGEKDIKIAFNTNYFLEAVKMFDAECETIVIKLSGPLSPALIKNPEKDNYLYILVPMRTNN